MKYVLEYPLRLLWAIIWCSYVILIIIVVTTITFIWNFRLNTACKQFILKDIWLYPLKYSWEKNQDKYKSAIHWAFKIK